MVATQTSPASNQIVATSLGMIEMRRDVTVTCNGHVTVVSNSIGAPGASSYSLSVSFEAALGSLGMIKRR